MREKDEVHFRRFLAEIHSESDRGLALVGAAFIEEKLGQTLLSFFCTAADSLVFGRNAPLGTFANRIEACHALGLIEEVERHDCDYVRRVRNEFAHSVTKFPFTTGK